MIDKIIAAVESRMLGMLGDKLTLETDFDPDTLVLTTVSYWDNQVVSSTDFDMTEIVEAIVARLQ